MLKIIDVSHHQGTINWDVLVTQIDGVVIRTSFAADGRDRQAIRNTNEARRLNLPIWFYHYAYPNRQTSPTGEVNNFLNAINACGGLQPGNAVVLDFEENYADAVRWCTEFCRLLKERVGFAPLFYSNEARITGIDWQPIVDLGCGLWVAKYGINDGQPHDPPATGKWPFAAMWQYTSAGKVTGVESRTVDLNQFFGDINQFKAYGMPGNTPVPAPQPVPPSPPAPTPAPTPPANENFYVVKSGDTMSKIAGMFGMSLQALIKMNPEIKDPNKIFPGQRIRVKGGSPTPQPSGKYTVKLGDTMSKIATAHNMTLAQLIKKNPQIKDPNKIYPGQVINL